ncbi:SDR family oxidoreductase, partial [Lactobacillus acidophilus]
PGPVEGPRIERVIEAQAEARDVPAETVRQEEYFDDLALAEFIDPDNIAEMIAYLASDGGRHITAQDINIDSGGTWY